MDAVQAGSTGCGGGVMEALRYQRGLKAQVGRQALLGEKGVSVPGEIIGICRRHLFWSHNDEVWV